MSTPQLLVDAPIYQYNETYQSKILALLVRYPQFIHRHGEVVRPEYFEYEDMRIVCRGILDFYRSYGVVPPRDSFEAWLKDYDQKLHPPQNVLTSLVTLVGRIFSCDLSDGEAVRETAVRFAQRQALKRSLKNITERLDNFNDDSFNYAQHEIQSALMVGQGLGNLGTEVFGTIPRLPGLLSEQSQYSHQRKIPTPFPSLNNATRGGLGPGELFVVIGSSGQGKSHIKKCFGTLASHHLQGQWVAHATLELSELDNHLRYAAEVLDMSMDDIVANRPEFLQKVGRMATDRRIFVKWFPPMSTTVGALRSWISALCSELGVGPCMIIVDYPDFLVPAKGATDSLYIDNAKIYSEIITLLNEYQCCGVVSSQLDRYHQNSDKARANNVSNSIAKLYNADIVCTINQTEEDMQTGVGRLWIDKNRRGRGKFFIQYNIDYAKSSVREDFEVQNYQRPPQCDSAPAPVAPPPMAASN